MTSSSSSTERITFFTRVRTVVPLGWHHLLMLFIATAIILLSLLLAGCSSSSPGITGIFLISFYYQQYTPTYALEQVDPGVVAAIRNIVGAAQLEVRVGYFGICVNADGGSFLCSNNATSLALQTSIEQDPLNLIWVADTFKNSVVFPYLIIIAVIFSFVVFLLLATFPGWHDERVGQSEEVEVLPFPSRAVAQAALALIFIASVFILVSVLWQHTASVAATQIAKDLGNGNLNSGVGVTAMVLGWFSFALLTIVTIGLLVIILSINVLRQIAEEG